MRSTCRGRRGSRVVAMTLERESRSTRRPLPRGASTIIWQRRRRLCGPDRGQRLVRRRARPRRARSVACDQPEGAGARPHSRRNGSLGRCLPSAMAPRHDRDGSGNNLAEFARALHFFVSAFLLRLQLRRLPPRQQLDTLSPAQAISRAAAASPKPVRALFQFEGAKAPPSRAMAFISTAKRISTRPRTSASRSSASAMPGLTKKYGAGPQSRRSSARPSS